MCGAFCKNKIVIDQVPGHIVGGGNKYEILQLMMQGEIGKWKRGMLKTS